MDRDGAGVEPADSRAARAIDVRLARQVQLRAALAGGVAAAWALLVGRIVLGAFALARDADPTGVDRRRRVPPSRGFHRRSRRSRRPLPPAFRFAPGAVGQSLPVGHGPPPSPCSVPTGFRPALAASPPNGPTLMRTTPCLSRRKGR